MKLSGHQVLDFFQIRGVDVGKARYTGINWSGCWFRGSGRLRKLRLAHDECEGKYELVIVAELD